MIGFTASTSGWRGSRSRGLRQAFGVQADVGGAVGERGADDRPATSPACSAGTVQLEPNGPKSMSSPSASAAAIGGQHVRPGLALHERLDGELEHQHAWPL